MIIATPLHGILIVFDTNTNNYATDITLNWYRNNELIISRNYKPNSARYFCSQDVVAYNKIEIIFRKTNIGYRYLRIFYIEDGITRIFYNDEFKNLRLLEEISSTTENLSMNTLNIDIHSRNEVGVLFQKTLPLTLYRDEKLVGSFFVDTADKENETEYKISAVDYIGLIEKEKFMGGMYSSETVGNIVASILGDIPYSIDEEISSRTLTGYIEIISKREALQKVIFSAGGIIDCSRSDKIEIKAISDNITSILDKDRIVSIKENVESITTTIELVEHKYTPQEEKTIILEDTINGDTLVTFSSPYTTLAITGGSIVSSNANYAIITGNGSIKLTGYSYDDATIIKRKSNPLTVSTDVEKTKSYNTTLICNEINLIDYFKFISKTLTVKFNMNNNEKVGDKVIVLGKEARIISLDYTLNTPSIYASAKMEV